jgi:apolipoprotein N-acyltransferase
MIALIITVIAALIFKRTGPWGTAWAFFLFLFLVLWMVSIYLRNVGPVYWGIAWLPLLLSAVLPALLLANIIPDANHWRDESLKNSGISKESSLRKSAMSHGFEAEVYSDF